MKKWMALACVLVMLCFVAGLVYAAEGNKGEKPEKREGEKGPRMMGEIKAIDAANNKITIAGKEGAEKVFTVTADTKIFVGKESGKTLNDLAVGMRAHVIYKGTDAEVTAVEIRAWQAGEKKGHDK